ncbi:hypothetical protein Ancab_026986 [Ancistrocladus abbreviatus]
MKREGRQHGVVRTYYLLPNPSNDRSPKSRRLINNFDSPATAGIFTRVSSKPTNHSKFTGKCDRRRCSPVSKSKDKSKGALKLRSYGDDLNFNFHGYPYSASTILDELTAPTYYLDLDYHDLDSIVDPESNYVIENDHRENDDHHNYQGIDEIVSVDDTAECDNEDDGDDDDDDMGFVDVGFIWDAVDGDEGWSIVGEMW